jgi:purine-binding chemotaxis protein CheW
MTSTYLSFVVCDELFAVNVAKVLEVLQKQQVTHVPNAPDYIKGIINFRGEVVPVFESRVKFQFSERPQDASYVVIVLDLSTDSEIFRIGAVVDKVKDVIVIDDSDIKPVPAMSNDFNTDFLQGIFKLNDNFILLLDVDKVFSSEEMINLKHSKNSELQNQL